MIQDPYPEPVSDPEALGLPDTADDDSTAWDDVVTGRTADGPDPAALPLGRGDRPVAVDRFGTTPEEALAGEPLDQKLGAEMPDPALEDVGPRADDRARPESAETFDADPLDDDLDTVDADTAMDTAVIEPNLKSPVSMYDTGIGGRRETVGRLVRPDEGASYDTEKDAVAWDERAAGGGASVEERAIHPLEE